MPAHYSRTYAGAYASAVAGPYAVAHAVAHAITNPGTDAGAHAAPLPQWDARVRQGHRRHLLRGRYQQLPLRMRVAVLGELPA